MRICTFLVALAVLASPIPVAAQQDPAGATKLIISDRAIAAGVAATPAAPAQPGGDSLKNGAIIGAVVGGIATAAFLGYVCSVFREPSDPPCWQSVGVIGLLGAGVGAAAGAGIDALASASAPSGLRPASPLRGFGETGRRH